MQVVYKKKSIIEKIAEECRKAKDAGKQIEKIILTGEEWKSFNEEVNTMHTLNSFPPFAVADSTFDSVLIECEEKD